MFRLLPCKFSLNRSSSATMAAKPAVWLLTALAWLASLGTSSLQTLEETERYQNCTAQPGACTELIISDPLFGTLPSELGELTALTELDLYQNYLSGTLPTELGRLTNLQLMALDSNQLTGTLPTQLGRIQALTR
ncbi:hypothetical protein CYMTET_35351, partial [Cymbomonas tetramitiformis]